MTRGRMTIGIGALFLAGFIVTVSAAADSGITLVGFAEIPGNLLDKSKQKGDICALDIDANVTGSCIDKALFGGFGSGLAYTGHDNVFLAVSDRGPFDGRTDKPYQDRFHYLQITLNSPNITVQLLDTRLFENEQHKSFVGDAYAFDQGKKNETLRFDPEGVRASGDGNMFVTDEYGPYLFKFDADGQLMARIDIPEKFLLKPSPLGHKSGDVDTGGNSFELYLNNFGRQANRGMEGLAITPDGSKLIGIMQNALLQDKAIDFNSETGLPERVGVNTRILTIDLATGVTHEYVYPLEATSRGRGVNEMLAINDHELLVLERDNRVGDAAQNKTIYKIDLNKAGLTDVKELPSPLPVTKAGLAAISVTPVDKVVFINMLNPAYLIDGTHTIQNVVAEKIEGMAWGPDLADGRHLLYVTSDNDLMPNGKTQIYAFAVDASASGANVVFQPQDLPEPMFVPHGHGKKQ